MRKIGKEVLLLGTFNLNPRNGEGAFVRLRDGSILYAFTEYCSESWDDHAQARISCVKSYDEGETWSEREILLTKGANDLNIMSVSFVRMQNGNIGILYLVKSKKNGKLLCMPYFRYSADECRSWSQPVSCIPKDGYYVVNNDRIVSLVGGRIMFPAARHGETGETLKAGIAQFYYSDDYGNTWQKTEEDVYSPYQDSVGLQEPGIYEYEDGRLWAWFRTGYGYQYQSFSDDGGNKWTSPVPNFHFSSPDSPMQVKKLSDFSVAVFNPIAMSCVNAAGEIWKSAKRTPYVLCVSKNDGKTFDSTGITLANGKTLPFNESCFYIEDDFENSYCYPAVIETKDGFLIAYYHSNGTNICLNAGKITKVLREEIGI
ncbi:MAG: exo-alpha-sialidase [Clostridia bacterium]|nr:exo-alpha-sialidase [Clostridia bacterium]MBQ4158622.1 exo-alpha-sialidase [Clostridia bacterium]